MRSAQPPWSTIREHPGSHAALSVGLGAGLDFQLELALHAALVDRSELPRVRRGHLPVPRRVARERRLHLLGVREEVAAGVRLLGRGGVEAAPAALLVEDPEGERHRVDADVRVRLDVRGERVHDLRVEQVDALPVVLGRAREDLLVVRVLPPVLHVVVPPDRRRGRVAPRDVAVLVWTWPSAMSIGDGTVQQLQSLVLTLLVTMDSDNVAMDVVPLGECLPASLHRADVLPARVRIGLRFGDLPAPRTLREPRDGLGHLPLLHGMALLGVVSRVIVPVEDVELLVVPDDVALWVDVRGQRYVREVRALRRVLISRRGQATRLDGGFPGICIIARITRRPGHRHSAHDE